MMNKRITLKDLEVLVLDCQATSSNPDKGHILEMGWVKTRASAEADFGKVSKKAETYLVKTPRGAEIPKAVLKITGISQEEMKAAQNPRDTWQRLSRKAEDVTKNIDLDDTSHSISSKTNQNLALDNDAACPAVIHFCRYEEPFLRKLHEKYNPEKAFPFSIVCTHEIVKRLLPGLPRKSLRAVAGYFGQSLPESRRCLHHVVATALMWHHLVILLEESQNIDTFDELQEWLLQPATHVSNRKTAREYPMAETYRKDLPNLPGVYRMYRSGGDLLYIGKAKSLRQRISSYFRKGSRHPEHILEMLSQAQSLDTTVTRTAFKAALVESDEIKRFSPPYNRSLRTNEREVRFFSRDLKSSNPRVDRFHSIGPLPSSYNLTPLILLGDALNDDFRKISRQVIEGILDIPSEYLPNRACFVSGVKEFKQKFQTSLHPTSVLKAWMSLGVRFWKEKLEEQAAEETAKREAAEESARGEAETTENAKKEALESIVTMGALGGNIKSEPEAETKLVLEMQEFEDKEIEDTWTTERIVKILKSIIRLGTFQIRRSRWFCRLSESTLVWSPSREESNSRNLIVFESGTPLFKDPLSPSETVPPPPRHTIPLIERQKNFDLLVFDRMRVTTTEIRRLIQEGRRVELWLHPDVCLRNEQLKRMLLWV